MLVLIEAARVAYKAVDRGSTCRLPLIEAARVAYEAMELWGQALATNTALQTVYLTDNPIGTPPWHTVSFIA